MTIAHAVCDVMGGSTPAAIFAPQRGTPRTVDLRAVTMFLWREWSQEEPSYTQTGKRFFRNRRNVQRGLVRLEEKKLLTPKLIREIRKVLDGEGTEQ